MLNIPRALEDLRGIGLLYGKTTPRYIPRRVRRELSDLLDGIRRSTGTKEISHLAERYKLLVDPVTWSYYPEQSNRQLLILNQLLIHLGYEGQQVKLF